MSINNAAALPINLDGPNSISYSASTTLLDAGDWGARFTNSQPDDCESSCSVLDSMCKNSGDSRVSLGDSGILSVKQDEPEGYVASVCI